MNYKFLEWVEPIWEIYYKFIRGLNPYRSVHFDYLRTYKRNSINKEFPGGRKYVFKLISSLLKALLVLEMFKIETLWGANI